MPSVQYLPEPPAAQAPWTDAMYWRQWLQKIFKAFTKNLMVAPIQTATFTADINFFLYPCDTTAAGFVAGLPAAAECMGKEFCFIKTAGAVGNTITVTNAAVGDTIFATTATISAVGASITYVSDGVSRWYAISSA